jgi:2-polyprenyl-3-methyl-5-hydroxy-6-metoxy-1,4-benzoquinol methylase
MDYVTEVREYYDGSPAAEWERLEKNLPEFEITRRFIERYIKPGDTALDVGGGPGRYSLHLAKLGCEVTLADLSQGNVDFAMNKAREQGLNIRGIRADARYIDREAEGEYDHVLVMGPMYHLLEPEDRGRAMTACLSKLKPGGLVYVSFISIFAGFIYWMKYAPELLLDPGEEYFINRFLEDKDYAGPAFTQAYFSRWRDTPGFMGQFGLEKLHLFGQEGITAPCGENILASSPDSIKRWLDISEKVCERENLLCFAEHYMYIGRKPK